MDSEDTLLLLYTSGSTNKPKGKTVWACSSREGFPGEYPPS